MLLLDEYKDYLSIKKDKDFILRSEPLFFLNQRVLQHCPDLVAKLVGSKQTLWWQWDW
jgi:hypothetical protein